MLYTDSNLSLIPVPARKFFLCFLPNIIFKDYKGVKCVEHFFLVPELKSVIDRELAEAKLVPSLEGREHVYVVWVNYNHVNDIEVSIIIDMVKNISGENIYATTLYQPKFQFKFSLQNNVLLIDHLFHQPDFKNFWPLAYQILQQLKQNKECQISEVRVWITDELNYAMCNFPTQSKVAAEDSQRNYKSLLNSRSTSRFDDIFNIVSARAILALK